MKAWMRVVLAVIALTVGANLMYAQVLGDFQSHQTGNWNDVNSWERYDGSNWITPAPSTPTSSDGKITILNGHTITVSADVTADSTFVSGALTIAAVTTFIVPAPSGTERGIVVNVGGSVTVNGTYNHNRNGGALPDSGRTVWGTGSTCLITGITANAPSYANQSFYNFTWNCPSQTTSVNVAWNGTTIGGDVSVLSTNAAPFFRFTNNTFGSSQSSPNIITINGNLLISGNSFCTATGSGGPTHFIRVIINGNISFTGSATSSFQLGNGSGGQVTYLVRGNVTTVPTAGGTFTTNSGATVPDSLIFAGTGTQTFSNSVTSLSNIKIAVNDGATLSMDGANTMGTSASTTFTLFSGATFACGHANGLNGNITAAGTKTFAADANFTFNGSSAQATGALLPATVNNLTINNTAGVTLGSSINVNGALAVNGGKLTLGTNNVVAASVTGGSTSNYVVTDNTGVLKINNVGASNITFPVGTATGYNPVTINNAGTADNFSVRVSPTFSNPTSSNQTVDREWTITEDGSGANATLSLQWNTADEDPTFVRTSPTFIGRYDGSQWVQTVAAYTDLGGGVYKVTAGGFTTFSPFGVGNDGALPIQLASFTARMLSSTSVRLDWETISEINNYGFEVQRSSQQANGFQSISTLIPGNGTTNERHSYSYTDNTASVGQWFYRLKQIDLDGTVHFTEPIQVDVLTAVTETAPLQFALSQNYPNPFNPSTNIKFSVEKTAKATLEVFNMLGQKVLTLFDETAEAGKFYTVKMNTEHLSSGMYLYRLESNNKSEMKKLVLLK